MVVKDYFIKIIPEDEFFRPNEISVEKCKAYLKPIVPNAECIKDSQSDGVNFHDCGGKKDEFHCPYCCALISEDRMWEWTNQWKKNKDYLKPNYMPCCDTLAIPNQIIFHYPRGFSSWNLEITRPNKNSPFTKEEIADIEKILLCKIRIIYGDIRTRNKRRIP